MPRPWTEWDHQRQERAVKRHGRDPERHAGPAGGRPIIGERRHRADRRLLGALRGYGGRYARRERPLSGVDVELAWDADPANAQYQVGVSTDPYFDPDIVTPLTVTADTTYIDTGAAASLENHFYVVHGVNACAVASGNSGQTGEFTFGLVPGVP